MFSLREFAERNARKILFNNYYSAQGKKYYHYLNGYISEVEFLKAYRNYNMKNKRDYRKVEYTKDWWYILEKKEFYLFKNNLNSKLDRTVVKKLCKKGLACKLVSFKGCMMIINKLIEKNNRIKKTEEKVVNIEKLVKSQPKYKLTELKEKDPEQFAKIKKCIVWCEKEDKRLIKQKALSDLKVYCWQNGYLNISDCNAKLKVDTCSNSGARFESNLDFIIEENERPVYYEIKYVLPKKDNNNRRIFFVKLVQSYYLPRDLYNTGIDMKIVLLYKEEDCEKLDCCDFLDKKKGEKLKWYCHKVDLYRQKKRANCKVFYFDVFKEYFND